MESHSARCIRVILDLQRRTTTIFLFRYTIGRRLRLIWGRGKEGKSRPSRKVAKKKERKKKPAAFEQLFYGRDVASKGTTIDLSSVCQPVCRLRKKEPTSSCDKFSDRVCHPPARPAALNGQQPVACSKALTWTKEKRIQHWNAWARVTGQVKGGLFTFYSVHVWRIVSRERRRRHDTWLLAAIEWLDLPPAALTH